MTDDDFVKAMERMGFERSKLKHGITERWDHVRGGCRWVTIPKHLNDAQKEVQLNSVKKSLRVH